MIPQKYDFTRAFYVVGGTMHHDAPSYIERRADAKLFNVLLQGEFCYVLTARQMGKSSLMIRTAMRLRGAKIDVAVLDLTAVGQNLTVEQWYGGLIAQVGQRLDLEEELIAFWLSHPMLGPMQRWMKAIRTIVLPRHPNCLVIFIDEIDAVRSLPFSTDEFFASIRECYNRRNEDPEMRRLTFCLLGVATPSDLIRETRTTPFNIGRRIELHDFTETEASPLACGLHLGSKQGSAILKRVLHWTGGHPYLTQRLCRAVAEDASIQNDAGVDRLCQELFFSRSAQERDDNLLFVRECILRNREDLSSLLELYARVRNNKPVNDDETNPLINILRLSGITRVVAGRLKVRNRIYSRVFDGKWVAANTPDAEKRRQRAAYWRGVWRTASVSALILSLVGWLTFTAIEQGKRAEAEASINRRLLNYTQLKLAPQEWQDISPERVEDWLTASIYHTQVKLALQEWNNSNIDRVEELLNSSEPQEGQKDWRSFEWYWLWRLTRSERARLKESGQVAGADFMPSGKMLVVGAALRAKPGGADEYSIKIYDLNTSNLVNSFHVPAGRNFDLVTFSPDRQSVAMDGPDSVITLRDIHTGREIRAFKDLANGITAIAFSPDGKRIAGGDFNNVAKVWDVTGGKETVALKGLKQWIRWATFSPDGRLLATTDESEMVSIWDPATGRELQPFTLKGSLLSRAFFSPDGKKLITTTTDGHLNSWDVRTRRVIATLIGHAGEVRSIAFSPDGKTVATGSVDRTIRLWKLEGWQEMATIRGHGSAVHSVAFSADGKYIVSGSPDGAIKIWDVADSLGPTMPDDLVVTYFTAGFSPDGELIAAGATKDWQVKVWNLSIGKEVANLNEGARDILYAAFSPDMRLLATCGLDRLVKLWDVKTGKQMQVLRNHTDFVYSVEFSPDGQLLVSGGKDRTLRLWSVASGQQIDSLDNGEPNSYRAGFSPDGKLLASACRDGSVNLWDIASRRVIHSLVGHTDIVRAISFSRDGRYLATGGKDNVVRLWDATTGEELTTLGKVDSVRRITFSSDGLRLVTGGEDGSVILWDVTTRQQLMTFKGHLEGVSSVVFSSDGMNLAVTSSHGGVRLWRAAIQK